ncbi:MAG: universal stress protein [Alphaproteobacteria bacterium]|nr:universal stress protein [Alphaproteobacteria bacterium]
MKVLVGVDLNVQGHDWLLDRAARFAGAIGAVVDLVFVASTASKEHEALLSGLLTLLPEERRGTTRVETGDPADALVALTREYDALIVGPREPAMFQRWLLGPMAVRVLRRSVCPILVPRGERPPTDHPRLLAGLDVNGGALQQVLQFSKDWVVRLGGTLDGVYAIPDHLPPIANKAVREGAEREWMARHEPERQKLEELLATVDEAHRGAAVLRAGEPEDVLLQLSKDYDVVLVGNRGRQGISRIIMGNVANHVVRTAHCDVLVLPTAALLDEVD